MWVCVVPLCACVKVSFTALQSCSFKVFGKVAEEYLIERHLAADFVHILSIRWWTWLFWNSARCCVTEIISLSETKNETAKMKYYIETYWISRLKKCFLRHLDTKSRTPISGPKIPLMDFIKHLNHQSHTNSFREERKRNTSLFYGAITTLI